MKLRWQQSLPESPSDVRWCGVRTPAGAHEPALAVAVHAGPTLLLDGTTGETLARFDGHPGGTLAVSVSPDGGVVATTGLDGTIALHDVATSKVVARVQAGDRWAAHVAWSPDGESLASAAGKTVRLWSRDGTQRAENVDSVAVVSCLTWFSPRDAFLAGCYGSVSFLGAHDLASVEQLPFRASILGTAVSADDRYLALACQDPLVHVWDLRDYDAEINLTGYKAKVHSIDWSPSAPLLATASGTTVVLWPFLGRVPYDMQSAEIAPNVGRVAGVAFADEGRKIVAVGSTGKIAVIGADANGQPGVVHLEETSTPLYSIAPAPDRRAFATGGRGAVAVWEIG